MIELSDEIGKMIKIEEKYTIDKQKVKTIKDALGKMGRVHKKRLNAKNVTNE